MKKGGIKGLVRVRVGHLAHPCRRVPAMAATPSRLTHINTGLGSPLQWLLSLFLVVGVVGVL